MRKQNIFKYLLIAVVALSAAMSACTVKNEAKPDSSVQWDPLSMKIFIKDTNSFDLLDTTSENYAGDQLTVKFKNKQYKINYPKSSDFAYEELLLVKSTDSARYCVHFNEIDGSQNYDDDFLVTWKVKTKGEGQPSATQTIIHMRHILFKDQSKTNWLVDGKETGMNGTSVAFEILMTFK